MLYDGDATCGHARTTGVRTKIEVAVGADSGVAVGRASHGDAHAHSSVANAPATITKVLRNFMPERTFGRCKPCTLVSMRFRCNCTIVMKHDMNCAIARARYGLRQLAGLHCSAQRIAGRAAFIGPDD